MKFLKSLHTSKPIQSFSTVNLSSIGRTQRTIRRPRPFPKIIYKAMLLRVKVYIENELTEVSIGGDWDTAKPLFKQAACALISFIDALSIGIKEIGKVL